MQSAFIYIWHDIARKMFYIGSHVGPISDEYLSSSHWLNGEIRFRPNDFRRKIVKIISAEDVRAEEYRLISMIKDAEFGKKYYNLKSGKPKGSTPWNKGRHLSDEHRKNLSAATRGRPAWNKGVSNPTAAVNGKKSADKVSIVARGRKMVIINDRRKWAYPSVNGWYIKNDNGEKVLIDFSPL